MARFCLKVYFVALILSLILQGAQSKGGSESESTPARSNGNGLNGTALPTAPPNKGDDKDGNKGQGSEQHAFFNPERPRTWGKENDRNETEFDDRKSPRKVAFLGRSANFRVYPNASDTSAYLQLRFGKVVEVDAGGRPVDGHAVPSLADMQGAVFSAGNASAGGVNYSYVSVSVNPTSSSAFRLACGNVPSAGHHHRRLLADPALQPQVNITVLFGLDGELVLPYGPRNVSVARNGLKFNVALANWPFCNTSNALRVSINLVLKDDVSAEPGAPATAANGTQQLSLSLGPAYNSTLTFFNYALDKPGGSVQMPVNVTLGQDDGKTSIRLLLPNPAASNATSVYYDPTSTTTSAYLTTSDPANGGAITTTAGGSNAGSGAASGLRTSALAAVAALLLSAFAVL